jgi:shikimate dehydrogenase
MRAGAHTGLLGVVGWPIAHSRSPAMQNAALAALGLDLVYLAFAVPSGKLPQAIDGARALGARGLNVTVPHKEAALSLCQPDALASAVGAVNTLVFDEDAIRGTNTDVHGFRALLEEAGGATPGRAVILGAGGAARAVVAALGGHSAAAAAATATVPAAVSIVTVSRSGRSIPGAAAARWPETAAETRALLEDCTLLVDATPRGLAGAASSAAQNSADSPPSATPLALDALPPHALVLDLVVSRETALTRAARARGLRAESGAAMLLHQGAASLERWIGRPAPLDVMRAALDASLA